MQIFVLNLFHVLYIAESFRAERLISFHSINHQLRTERNKSKIQNLYRGSHAPCGRLHVHFDIFDMSFFRDIIDFETIGNKVSIIAPELSIAKDFFIFSTMFDVLEVVTKATLIARLASMSARIFGFESEVMDSYDNSMILQAPLIIYSVVLFVKTVVPPVSSFFTPVTKLDKIAYLRLLKPVGISWMQFKVLLTQALDWVYIEPFTVIQNEGTLRNEDDSENDYLYWLNKGDVAVSCNGVNITTIERKIGKGIDDSCSVGLIADMRFLYRLDQRMAKKMKKRQNNSDNELMETMSMSTFTTGSQGAEMLRIDTTAVLKLIDTDERLERSFKMLLLKSVQRKVVLYLRKICETSDELEKVSTSTQKK